MKLVVAIGGNALLRSGQAPSAANLLANVRLAAVQLARLARLETAGRPTHQIVLTHGSGPQVGLLALQSAAYAAQHPGTEADPLDMLDAEVAGLLGYVLEQEIANLLPPTRTVASLLTRVQVSRQDPAFQQPTKPIGPTYTPEQARKAAEGRGWTLGPDRGGLRRLVASPRPVRVCAMNAITTLLDSGALVIAGGGGGIPVVRRADGPGLEGVEAVVDKDLCTALIATGLKADCLIIATDVDGVYVDWGAPGQRRLGRTTPDELAAFSFAAGSMAPKVEAAVGFVKAGGGRAVIGLLDHIEEMLAGQAGTQLEP
jgi:carbamate kinase